MTFEIFLSLLAATVQAGTPILYATLGEIVTERSGVLNLGVEGIMLVGALAAFLTAMMTGSPLLAFVVGGLAGLLLAGVHGVVCLWFQGNQVVSGLALTILGTGLANYWGTPYIGQSAPGFDPFSLPLLGNLPVLGTIFFQHDLLVYFSYLLPVLLWLFLRNTSWGMALRAVGEYPDAAEAAGVSVQKWRWAGILGGGFLVGLGGASLSLAYPLLEAGAGRTRRLPVRRGHGLPAPPPGHGHQPPVLPAPHAPLPAHGHRPGPGLLARTGEIRGSGSPWGECCTEGMIFITLTLRTAAQIPPSHQNSFTAKDAKKCEGRGAWVV